MIEGEVTGPAGEAVPGVWVSGEALSASGRRHFSVQVRGGTHFKVGPVLPGRYRLQATAGGAYLRPAPVEIVAPTDGAHILIPKGFTIRGTLVGAERPERFVATFLPTPPGGGAAGGGSVTSAGQFLVTLAQDAVGILYFRNVHGGDLYGWVEGVRPGGDALEVHLQKGETIEGRFDPYEDGDEGYVDLQAANGLNLNGKVAKDGSFVVHGVPPGTYNVRGIRAHQWVEPIPDVRAGTKGLVLRGP